MLKSLWFKNIVFITLFIFLALVGEKNAALLLIQLTLPLLLLNQSIKLSLYIYRIRRIYENYRRIFQDLNKINNKDYKNPEIIINVIEYESTLSWGGILLSTKKYNKLNPELSKKWEENKIKYGIK